MNILLYGKSNVALRRMLSLLKAGDEDHCFGVLSVPVSTHGVLAQACEQCSINPEEVKLFVASNEDFHLGEPTCAVIHYTGKQTELFREKMLPVLLEGYIGLKDLITSSCISG